MLTYKAWFLHFRESTGTGYVPIFLVFILQRAHVVLLWCARGTPVVKEFKKKMQFFFSLSFIHFFFVYRKIYVFYLFNLKEAALL
jgi:hypothetical protein